jgi:hypothetical protein
VFPQGQELWAVFLSGGLFGVLLYRLWTMILLSFLGVVVSWHAAFGLAQSSGSYDAVKWVADNTIAVNGAVIIATFLGVLMQVVTTESPPVEATDEKSDKDDHKSHDVDEPVWWKRIGLKAA